MTYSEAKKAKEAKEAIDIVMSKCYVITEVNGFARLKSAIQTKKREYVQKAQSYRFVLFLCI